MSDNDLREYLSFAEDLAKQAGKIAKQFEDAASIATDKTDKSPLTVADEKINQLVIDAVKSKYPKIGVLGEEKSHKSGKTNGLLWVCDPIDGTLPYILGASISTFCLALVDDGDPVVGVVYVFSKDQLFSAAKGLGVWRNGTAFKPGRPNPSHAVASELWYASPAIAKSHLKKLYDAQYLTPTFFSTSFDGMQLAEGKIKGVIYANNKPWDFAAAKVILDELGIRVTDLEGNEQRYDQSINGIIASDGSVHKELLQ
ncbi:MAG TPA: inositol monophosphatase [Candidatus Saccharimonadales bacterium]|nr:inositol monophosphatase [Candidatus Saccharimonadales bacterium]